MSYNAEKIISEESAINMQLSVASNFVSEFKIHPAYSALIISFKLTNFENDEVQKIGNRFKIINLERLRQQHDERFSR